MFSWGEDFHQGFRTRPGPTVATKAGVRFLDLSYQIRDLSAGHRELAFIKTQGATSIIRTHGGRKQKFVKCEEKIRAVCCGDNVVTLLSDGGSVFCVDTTQTPLTPRPLEIFSKLPVSQVACGSQHSVALTRDGQVYTWGQDSRGQLGLGRERPSANSPQHVRSLSAAPLVQIAAGGEQSFALSVSGGVFGWGRNDRGQLGLGDTTDRQTPNPVRCLDMKKIIHISCGMDHTAVLAKDGAVFTFGSGQHGQLGHDSLSDELHPRLVAEHWGSKVAKIACGWHHTIVLTDSGRVFSFGRGEQGQLGREANHPSVPLPVNLPPDTPNGDDPRIRNIYAGANCSFATCTANEDEISQYCLDGMIDRWSGCDSKSWKIMKQEVHKMFSSASCLNQSFLDRSQDKHFQTSSECSGLDLSLAKCGFEKLLKRRDVFSEVKAAVLHLLPSLDVNPLGVEELRLFLVLHELLHVMQTDKRWMGTELAEAVAAALLRLPDVNLQVIGAWWSSLPIHSRCQYIMVWKNSLSDILSVLPNFHNPTVQNLLLILQLMYTVNKGTEGYQRIPEKAFSMEIDQITLTNEVQRQRLASVNKDLNNRPFILHDFPFVMDLNSKKKTFEINAMFTQEEHVFAVPGARNFELNVRRAFLLEDTFIGLAAADHAAYKKFLVVYFDGDPKNTQVNRRDLFHHFFRHLLSAKSEMFMLNDSKRLAWFTPRAAEEDKRDFFLFGVLCGLALYNTCMIDLPFPLALFKKLLGVEPTLEDLKEFSPVVAQSLQYVLDYEDDLEDLDQEFNIHWDGTDVDLDPQNPGKLVTSENKKQFVDAAVTYAFNTSVETVFREFERGFFMVCDREWVKLFQPKELQGVLVGKDSYDWVKFKRNTVYFFPYHDGHSTIKMFWEVFDDLTEEQKKDFLLFVTGFRKAPIFGMDKIQMQVTFLPIQSSSIDHHRPEALTCHTLLELPKYSAKDVMRNQLLEALKPDKGFST